MTRTPKLATMDDLDRRIRAVLPTGWTALTDGTTATIYAPDGLPRVDVENGRYGEWRWKYSLHSTWNRTHGIGNLIAAVSAAIRATPAPMTASERRSLGAYPRPT